MFYNDTIPGIEGDIRGDFFSGGSKMDTLDDHYGEVRIHTLEPLRVASFQAASQEPEQDAFGAAVTWLDKHGLAHTAGRLFGFDVEVSPEQAQAGQRGYEVWATLPDDLPPSPEVPIKRFGGGLYAVMKVSNPFTDPFAVIPTGWQRLAQWAEASPAYAIGDHQWLEEHIETPEGTYLDLYLPISVKRET
jgi:AraC family transcriptional regulator